MYSMLKVDGLRDLRGITVSSYVSSLRSVIVMSITPVTARLSYTYLSITQSSFSEQASQ